MDIDKLAKQLSRDIFATGDKDRRPCTRLQFKSGDYVAIEVDNGGLCEVGLELNIRRFLKSYYNEESNK